MEDLTDGPGKSRGTGKTEDMFMNPGQIKDTLAKLNRRSANILPEEGKSLVNKLNKKNLALLERVKKRPNIENDGGSFGNGGQGAVSSSGSGGTGGSNDNGTGSDNKYSVTSIRKINDEESFIKSVLYATLNSVKSKSNTVSSDVQKIASFTPWSTPSEEILEFFYGEGVSILISPVKRTSFLVPSHNDNLQLTFRFHIRQLSCCQLNFIWVINRIYKDLVNLRIQTKGAADVRINEVMNAHWTDMEVVHKVKSEDVDACIAYLKTNFTEAYEFLSRREQKPKAFIVEFEVVDSCAGLLDSIESMRGAHFMELYGVEGKSQWVSKAHSNLSSSVSSNLKSIINNLQDTPINENTGDGSSSGGGGSSLFSSSSSTGRLNFAELVSAEIDEGNSDNTRGRKSDNKSNEFISEDKEAIFDIMDPLVVNASSKGSENSMLITEMINFLNKAADVREEADEENGADYEKDKFILSSQIDCLNTNSDLYTALLISNPANVYRLLTFLIPTLVCMRTRNVDNKSAPLANNRWEFGGGLTYKPYNYAGIRMRLDKTICRCRTLCRDTCSLTDKVTMENAREKFGDGIIEEAKTTKRFHNSHRIIHHDVMWFQKLLYYIWKTTNKNESEKPPESINLVYLYCYLAGFMEVLDTHYRCYSSSGLHHAFCPSVLVTHREGYMVHFKNNKLYIQGRRNGEKVITTMQGGQSKPAFERMVDSELTSTEAQTKYASSNNLSIREYGTQVSEAPAKLTKILRYMKECNEKSPSSFSHSLSIVLRCMNRLAEFMTFLQSFTRISIFDKSLEKYHRLNVISDENTDKKVKVNKAAISLTRDFMRLALENQNAAFLAAVNKKIFHSVIYTINGFRYTGAHARDVELQQFVGSISSSVVCADYYSEAFSKSKNLLDDEMSELFNENRWGGEEAPLSSESAGCNQKKLDMFLKLHNVGDFLSDDDDDADKGLCDNNGVTACSSLPASEVKKRKTEDLHQRLPLSDLEDRVEESDAGSITKKQKLSSPVPKEDQFGVDETYFDL